MAEQTMQRSSKPSSSQSPRFLDAAESDLKPAEDIVTYMKAYARERPEVAALWCFGIGFILGWKLKPW